MSFIYGNRLKLNIFGQSHGKAIGGVVEGLEPGFKVDFDELNAFLKRRAPGNSRYTTKRKESDIPNFISGIENGVLTGQPLAFLIENKNQRSVDYSDILDKPRPSHADYTAFVKYRGFADMRGGGHFSGRLTAPMAVAGGISLQILKKMGIEIYAHIYKLGEYCDEPLNRMKHSHMQTEKIGKSEIPVIDEYAGMKMEEFLDSIRREGDSTGAVIECAIYNLDAGYGDEIFDSIESRLSHGIFSIPGVKGVEFGGGFGLYNVKGSCDNDEIRVDEEGKVRFLSNNSSGINGGISNGMPIVFNVAVKPTPSIYKTQKTISLRSMENSVLEIKGRHDPCIALRAVPVVEAVAALTVLDIIYSGGFNEFK